VIDVLMQALSFTRDDPSGRKIRKLERGLSRMGFPVEEMVPLFAPLLSLPLPKRYAAGLLSPPMGPMRTPPTLRCRQP